MGVELQFRIIRQPGKRVVQMRLPNSTIGREISVPEAEFRSEDIPKYKAEILRAMANDLPDALLLPEPTPEIIQVTTKKNAKGLLLNRHGQALN